VAGYRGKRAFDVALVLITAPVWVPAAGVLALLVLARLGAPVFFTQSRPGRHGQPFTLVKFRTMLMSPMPDAERLTPLGTWLRAWSLDELPELLNVLRGDMSLVGPRPLLPQYLPLYSERHRKRHLVRPGITGLAQASGRNTLRWSDKFDLDVEYVERCSFRLDVAILWRTLRSVLRREGISAAGEATMPEFTGYE
jgi:lipopolysaccharide/colanic/teichoic acid biosynthesis glycosyltransferase